MCCVLMIVLMIMLVPDTLAVLVVDGLHFSERYARPLHSSIIPPPLPTPPWPVPATPLTPHLPAASRSRRWLAGGTLLAGGSLQVTQPAELHRR